MHDQGAPRNVVMRIAAEVQRDFKLPDAVDKPNTPGLVPWTSSPEELTANQAKGLTMWAKVVKESGAKAD